MGHPRLSKLLLRIKGRDTPDHAFNEPQTTTNETQGQQPPTTISSLPIELLQNIFSSLDFLALLKCRCVSRQWAASIPSSSPELQQALFLPVPRASLRIPASSQRLTLYFEIYTDSPPNYPPYSAGRVLDIQHVNKIALAYQTRGICVHPFIEKIDRFLVARIPDLEQHVADRGDGSKFTFACLRSKSGGLIQPDNVALWKGMFATFPPVTSLRVQFRYLNRDFGGIDPRVDRFKCVLDDDQGVLFGDLWHVLEKQVMGLLRRETLRRIDQLPEKHVCLADLKGRVKDTTCPV